MDIMDNVYAVALKNKHFLPHAVLFIIAMTAKKRTEEDKRKSVPYLGDNLPFSIVDGLKASSINGRRV